jgi:hypothetical protein
MLLLLTNARISIASAGDVAAMVVGAVVGLLVDAGHFERKYRCIFP